jgi:hypothetical protein
VLTAARRAAPGELTEDLDDEEIDLLPLSVSASLQRRPSPRMTTHSANSGSGAASRCGKPIGPYDPAVDEFERDGLPVPMWVPDHQRVCLQGRPLSRFSGTPVAS